MKILALDTATEACSVALLQGDSLIEKQVLARQHAERILDLVEQVMHEAQLQPSELDAIAFGRGPGMFTGLRIGAGVAQGIAFTANIPVVAVSSLAALAQGQLHNRVLALFDARMDQVYWGCYVRDENGFMVLQGEEHVDDPASVSLPDGQWLPVGSGWDQYEQQLQSTLGNSLLETSHGGVPSACDVARLGVFAFEQGLAVPAAEAQPVYIRDNVARKSVA